MKKFFALILAMLMVLTACSKVPEETEAEIEYNEKIPKTEATRIPDENSPAKMRVLNAFDEGISVEIKNISENEVIFSEDFSLQFKNEGKWYNLEYIADEIAFTEPAFILEPGESRTWNGDFLWIYGKLPEGEYRIIKTVVSGETFIIGAEFSLPFVPSAEEPETPEETGPEHLSYLREDFPKIDGSTSLIPLEAGIRAAIFGKTIEEATGDVVHTTTWESFNSLLSGDVDMIFSVDLSDYQKQQAEDRGIELEAVPVAYEGFIFVVNAKNPVDELTQEELRKIYSGEITNWKEVGGKNAEIVAYQRNTDSGSQNYMIDFMDEVPLMDAPKERRPGSMVGLMDVIAVNDNAENAIGYSVYTYAADMYGNGDEIKFIKVDGAEVNKNSMAKGEYPLLGNSYAIFRANEPENSPVRKLVEWIISDEGQLAAAKAGYVTMRDIGFDYSEAEIEKFEAVGTGIKKPEGKLPSYEYAAKQKGTGISSASPNLPLVWKDGRCVIDFLSDKNLENEINAFLLESYGELEEKLDEYEKYIESKKGNEEWSAFSALPYYTSWETRNLQQPCSVKIRAKNGIIWAAVSLKYGYDVQDGYDHYYATKTAFWDIESKKRLEPSDLFYKGTDIAEALNKYISGKSQEKVDAYYSYEMKADFASLPKDGWSITPDGIYFDCGNPYFAEGVYIDFKTLPEGILVTEQPKEMEGVFADSEIISLKNFREVNHKWIYLYSDENENGRYFSYALLPEDSYPTAKVINEQIESFIKKYYTYDTVMNYFRDLGYEDELIEEAFWWSDTSVSDLGGKYIFVERIPLTVYEYSEGSSGTFVRSDEYPYSDYLLFETETGKRIRIEDILIKGWKEHCVVTDGVKAVSNAEAVLKKEKLTAIYIGEYYNQVKFYIEGKYIINVDEEYIRW